LHHGCEVDPMSDRSPKLEALLPLVEGKPLAMAHLARQLQADGQAERAIDLCLRARAAAPDDQELTTLVASILSTNVPSWHFRIVRDEARNRAYESALARAVTPGCRVLEIGAGTGLLAMMAARAGAHSVVTCEANPVVARLARDIVEANGYGDRVRAIAKHSTALDAARDLGGLADVLVCEIFSNDCVSEGALPAIEDAWRRLLAPAARVIPIRVRVVVALAEDRRRDQREAGCVAGFDLSRFHLAAAPSYQIDPDAPRLVIRSGPATLFTFDFERDRQFPSQHASVALEANTGPVNGIAQWIGLDLDADIGYEVRPGAGARPCWGVMFHPFDRAFSVEPGRTIRVHGRHDRQSLQLWAAD
jgi:SAM-dependent methyltransferase